MNTRYIASRARVFGPGHTIGNLARSTQPSYSSRFAAPAFTARMSSTGPVGSGGRTTGYQPSGRPIDPKEASQFRGHAVWIKGMAEDVIGRAAGSKEWTEAGQIDKANGLEEMRAAKEEGDKKLNFRDRNPASLNAEGSTQKAAGIVTGCPGMKERGHEKQQAAKSKGT